MADYMSQMLNELMGPTRNALPGESQRIDFDHHDVCKDFLVEFCLHECFRNTKNDLGFCQFAIHDEGLRKRYSDSPRFGKLGYEDKFAERCRRLHNEVLRKIEKNESRLQVTQGEALASAGPYAKKMEEIEEKRKLLTERIEKLMEEAQAEGEVGNVGASQEAVEKADALQVEKMELDVEETKLKEEAKKTMAMENNVTNGNRQMQVCLVCGCFMLVNDAQSRIDDHLSGKLHIAYLRIKEHLEEYDKNKEEREKAGIVEEKVKEVEKDKYKSRDREDRHKRSRSRDRDRRDRPRDHRDKDRRRDDRDRHDRGSGRRDDRSHRRDRSRSRDRSRR